MTTRPGLLIRRPAFIEAELPDDEYLKRAIYKRIRPQQRGSSSRVVSVRVWQFSHDAYDTLVSVLKANNVRAEVYSPPGAIQPSATSKPQALSDRATLGVTEAAPWPVVESAYRAMALLYHPDRAGYQETERMKKINLAFGRLQEAQR